MEAIDNMISRPITMDVVKCPRCGGNHAALTFSLLDRPNEGWTHFALCPFSQQPVMVRTQEGWHPDDPTPVSQRLPQRQQAVETPLEAAGPLKVPPPSPMVDRIAEAVAWDGQTSLLSFIKERVGRHRPAIIRKIAEYAFLEAARLQGEGVENDVRRIGEALNEYAG